MPRLGPASQSGIIKNIPVTQNHGYMIHDEVASSSDHVDVTRRVINQLRFRIEDRFGHVVPLFGATWSASLVFTVLPESQI